MKELRLSDAVPAIALRASLIAALLTGGALSAHAVPVLPRSEAEVIETLPAAAGQRAEIRELRHALAARPGDVGLATRLARRYLDQARDQADPRFAGLALAALQRWADADDAPNEVLLLRATLQQHLHEFDAAAANLARLLRRDSTNAQAWLTLATIRRVQGRYEESDRACRDLGASQPGVHAWACLAENDALRGNVDSARAVLQKMLATPRLDASTRNWLSTTLAELEERAGNVDASNAAWEAAMDSLANSYTVLGYADFLVRRERYARALEVLAGEVRSDGVLLRLAIAGSLLHASDARQVVLEMRERIAATNLRPGARSAHAREQAMFALWVDKAPQRAYELAHKNVQSQREPIDLLILAQAARALGKAEALREAARVKQQIGLFDRRIDALL